jgi:hypothetical protein
VDTPLLGIALKLNRADEHFRMLRDAIKEFAESDFYDTVTELDYRGRLVGRAINVQQPPTDHSLLIGDCIHNYRSALDHLAYALASSYTNPLPEIFAKTSAFPIFNNGEKFRRRGPSGGVHKMRGMSRSARASIRRLQPYQRRKYPELWPLWMLEELSNIDKHRLLHLTATMPIQGSGQVGGTSPFVMRKIEAFTGPMKERAPLLRVTGEFERPRDMQVKPQINVDVAFDQRGEARSVRGLLVRDVLGWIRGVIGARVMPELDAEIARRLGVRFGVTITQP